MEPGSPLGATTSQRLIDDALQWTVRSLADELCVLEAGWAARTASMPLVHTLNCLHLRGEVDPATALALAEEHLSDLPYRHITVDDERTADTLEQAVGETGSGWRRDREVLMVLGEPPASGESRGAGSGEGGSATPGIVRLSAEESEELMRRWHVEEDYSDPDVLEQLAEYNRREGAMWAEHTLGVREEGRAVALTKSRAHNGIGWVEDVYTLPEARGKGYARLLVGEAVRRARAEGHGVTFILADDESWPKHLYAELGFEPVGCTWTFHRDLGS